MDWTTIIITIATCLITTLGASGIIALVFWKPTKRKKDAEATKAESDVENDELARWRALSDKLQEQLTEARNHIMAKNKQVDDLYDTIHKLEDALRVATNKYNSTLLFVDYIKHNYCIRRPCESGRLPEDVPSIDDIEQELTKKGLILDGEHAEELLTN